MWPVNLYWSLYSSTYYFLPLQFAASWKLALYKDNRCCCVVVPTQSLTFTLYYLNMHVLNLPVLTVAIFKYFFPSLTPHRMGCAPTCFNYVLYYHPALKHFVILRILQNWVTNLLRVSLHGLLSPYMTNISLFFCLPLHNNLLPHCYFNILFLAFQIYLNLAWAGFQLFEMQNVHSSRVWPV